MKLGISKKMVCGHTVNDIREYFWNSGNDADRQVDMSRYESFINFNKPGNDLYCETCNDYKRIKNINIRVIEFDARIEIL